MDKSSDSIRAIPDEENDPSAQPNIALMFELKEREIARRSRQKRTAVLLVSCGILLAIGTYAWLRSSAHPEGPITNGAGGVALPAITAREIREQGASDYTQKIIAVNGIGDKELPVNLYDFDANRFLSGKKVVDDPDELKRLLVEKSAELKSSLVVIFAGASFDGEPGNNRNLCRRRGCYVGELASAILGVAPKNLWMIAAGEHNAPGPLGSDDEKREEDVRASPNGEQVLRGQRKLLLITIPDNATGTAYKNASEVVRAVVESLRRGPFLPTDYDHGQSEPTRFADMKCDLLTP
ncbi:MAG TPA: hypothetical protein VEW46_19055 [Pyrinomonadaceae bacterium]|nr:hypothetical protein [Pyrinomonadaceae bacterium]